MNITMGHAKLNITEEEYEVLKPLLNDHSISIKENHERGVIAIGYRNLGYRKCSLSA